MVMVARDQSNKIQTCKDVVMVLLMFKLWEKVHVICIVILGGSIYGLGEKCRHMHGHCTLLAVFM